MHKLLTFASVATIALAASLATATPSSADPAGDAAGAAVAGGILGFMAGAAAAGGAPIVVDHPHHHHHMSDWAWQQHVSDCEDYYGWRYDPETDLVRGHHHSLFPCDL